MSFALRKAGMVVLIGMTVFSCTATMMTLDGSRRGAIHALKECLEDSDVVAARVLFLRYDIYTRIALSPEALEGHAQFNDVVSLSVSAKLRLVEVLSAESTEELDYVPDLRWGAIFLDSQGRERCSLFSVKRFHEDGKWHQGVVDGIPMRFSGAGILQWFEDEFGGRVGDFVGERWSPS